ncbi:hypothetical protein MA16_Dca018402 [Dendrobium catenatum]|uniref:Uncharacterized protein n=1 Tax=Dendrobium catenatum TaxID=906689 RepID=A0A2I0WHJ6_9ASPA|nr:hypothetical protein MA16_Dca018402 [Dendrobium catenatum]
MARAHIFLLFSMEVAPPQLIHVSKNDRPPVMRLETIVEEDVNAVESFSSSASGEKSASDSRSRKRLLKLLS